MTPFLLSLSALLATCAVGTVGGFLVGKAVRFTPDPCDHADLIAEAEALGYNKGYVVGSQRQRDAIEVQCRRVLDALPNSTGLRAAMRAIGFTVPPLVRKAKATATVTNGPTDTTHIISAASVQAPFTPTDAEGAEDVA